MSRKVKKSKGVVKGTGRAVVVAVLVHVGLFLLAGMLVVFTVVRQKEVEFEPPQATERPKMKLKKPKVRVKKNSRPKSSARITTTRANKSAMPSIDLPTMGGLGDGLGDGIGGFDIMPDFEQVTIFGAGQSIGSDFIGIFYDMKRTRSGSSRGDPGWAEMRDIVAKFTRNDFDKSKIAKYYQSPKKLYATSFMVPTVKSSTAPKAFGEDTGGWCWLVHYEGKLVHQDGIKFRFRGQGDDILIVRVDKKVVLNASWPGTQQEYSTWHTSHPDNRVYRMGNNTAVVGDWIELEPGVPLDMEVVAGEVPGGHFDMMLVVEVEGEKYPNNRYGSPIFPMFKTAKPSHELADAIFEFLMEGEASVTNGPVFSDFGGSVEVASLKDKLEAEEQAMEQVPMEEGPITQEPAGPRTWTIGADKTVQADFISFVGDKIALKTSRGKQIKVPLSQLSAEDREFVELANPPKFNLSFRKKSSQVMIKTTPLLNETPPQTLEWMFGAKLKQTSAGVYNHEVFVEYFAVGQQHFDDRKFILFDRFSSSFVPTKANDRSHEFMGTRKVETQSYTMKSQLYGRKYKGYLILVRDERGEIIQHAASNDWLFDNHEKLSELPIGAFFDKTCTRVYATGPKLNY